MALKPTMCTVYLDGGGVIYFKDEEVLSNLWHAVRPFQEKLGFVSGKGSKGAEIDGFPEEEGYYTINLSKIVYIDWKVEEVEDETPAKFIF